MFEGILYTVKSLLKKPFKVGLITYYYPEKGKSNNGVAIHTSYLAQGLAKLGCEVHVFTQGTKSYKRTEYFNEGKIVIHRLNTKLETPVKDPIISSRISYTLFDSGVITEVTKENSHEKFELIHTHGWLTGGAFICKHLNGMKWVHTFHALEKSRIEFMSKEQQEYFNVARWIESTIRQADLLIAVSNFLKIEVLKNYSLSPERIKYIPNGVDLDLFNQVNYPIQDKKILYVGRFSMEKGIDFIPRIVKNVFEKDNDIKFEIIAADQNIPPSLQKTKQQFEELEKKFPNRFIWHKEQISREALPKIYNEALIYIQPSRYDSFPTTVLEAMACGKAVICSNRGGMPDMVGNSGRIVQLNSSVFSKEILRLAENYKLRERYSRRALEKVKEYGWEKICKEMLKTYKGVAEKKEVQTKLASLI